MKTYEFYFKGIDCPNCAAKVERALNKDGEISQATVNFLSKKIIIETNLTKDVLEYTLNIVKSLEPDAELSIHCFGCDDHHEHEDHCCCHEHEDHCGCHEHTDHCCCHEDEHKQTTNISTKKWLKVALYIIGCLYAVAAFVIKLIFPNPSGEFISGWLYAIAYLLFAYKIIRKSLKNIANGNIFDENFLMMVASIGALLINEGLEAILVVILYTIGEYFQSKALGESTEAIANLSKLKVDIVHLESGQDILTKDVKIGDVIIVKVGECIPLDGTIIEGTTSLDTKTITGESIPSDAVEGDEVLSGCINLRSVIKVRVKKRYNESTTSKIIKFVEYASNKKSKTEEFITKFARVYTPIVLVLALIVFLVEWLIIPTFTLNDALNNCFVFLVASCPCALVISIPLAFYGGIGRCSSFGVLVKGGNFVEALSKTKVICFDKTGTLTKGEFKVEKIYSNNISQEEFLNILCSLESYSNHPIAVSISKLEHIKIEFTNIMELAGFGIKGQYNGKTIIAGNEQLMKEHNIEITKVEEIGSVVYLAVDGEFKGSILVCDEIKTESKEMIKALKSLNINPIILTGDNKDAARNVASKLEIDKVHAKLLPDEKLTILEKIIYNKEPNTTVVYVGDGINDAPSIKLADVGVAIGGLGNSEVVEISDVVLMSNNINSLINALKISKFTKKILIQNIVFALSIKFIALVIGTLGILGSYGMLLGVFADVGVCLITILNTLRILKYGGK